MTEFDIQPQQIDGSSLVVLSATDFDRLMDGTMYSPSFQMQPQFLNDSKKNRTHVVLTEDDFGELLNQLPDPERLFFISMPRKGVVAKSQIYDDGITIIRGSTLGNAVPSLPQVYRRERARLIEKGVVGTVNGRLTFLESCQLENPSEAACIITGDSKSGNNIWVDSGGNKLDDSIMARRR